VKAWLLLLYMSDHREQREKAKRPHLLYGVDLGVTIAIGASVTDFPIGHGLCIVLRNFQSKRSVFLPVLDIAGGHLTNMWRWRS
jgi:hypothetical protein